jgi:hypothetical protein
MIYPHEFKEVLAPYSVHVYPDTGGLYIKGGTSSEVSYLGSITPTPFQNRDKPVTKIVISNRRFNAHPEKAKAIQTICAIHGIQIAGLQD